jgi:prolyl 4-hydroxylase
VDKRSTDTAAQHITPDLRRWVASQLDAGALHGDILQAMASTGWGAGLARAALDEALFSRASLASASVPAAGPMPEPALAEGQNLVVADGHPVRIALSMKLPRVVVFDGLLSDAECDGLMDEARPRLARSETVDHATGGSEVNAARTSEGMFFSRGESPLIARIESRIAALLQWPADHGEGLQILRYRPGAEYRPHYDYFDPAQPGTPAVLRRGGQRLATLVIYLKAPERGGATSFPDVGLEVAPRRGSAVFFSYDRPAAATRTLHGGSPVLEGEKWVATKWLREGVFT